MDSHAHFMPLQRDFARLPFVFFPVGLFSYSEERVSLERRMQEIGDTAARKQKKLRSRFLLLYYTPAFDDDEPASAVQVYSQTVCQERERSRGLPVVPRETD